MMNHTPQQTWPVSSIQVWSLTWLLTFSKPHRPSRPVTERSILAAERFRADQRALLRRWIVVVLGATQWGKPPPGTTMRSAFGMFVLSTIVVVVVLLRL